jgi:L-iditol 2-dehydrogenase
MQVQAWFLLKRRVLELRPIEVSEPGLDEVLVRPESVGVCGSDVHYYEDGRIGDFIVRKPLILGHETSGTIIAVGPNVDNFAVGDRVAVEPGVPCSHCRQCIAGQYNLCPNIRFHGTPPVHGSLRDAFVHNAHFVYRLPDNMTFPQGAMSEPLSVGIHACRRGGVKFGSRVLISGAGPIGLTNVICGKLAGASIIAVIETNEERIAMARQCGATHVIPSFNGKEILSQTGSISHGEGFDVAIECSGSGTAVTNAVKSLGPAGALVLVGFYRRRLGASVLNTVVTREIALTGIFRYANTYPTAIQLISSGHVNVDQLISKTYKWSDADAAIQNAGKNIKGMIMR